VQATALQAQPQDARVLTWRRLLGFNTRGLLNEYLLARLVDAFFGAGPEGPELEG